LSRYEIRFWSTKGRDQPASRDRPTITAVDAYRVCRSFTLDLSDRALRCPRWSVNGQGAAAPLRLPRPQVAAFGCNRSSRTGAADVDPRAPTAVHRDHSDHCGVTSVFEELTQRAAARRRANPTGAPLVVSRATTTPSAKAGPIASRSAPKTPIGWWPTASWCRGGRGRRRNSVDRTNRPETDLHLPHHPADSGMYEDDAAGEDAGADAGRVTRSGCGANFEPRTSLAKPEMMELFIEPCLRVHIRWRTVYTVVVHRRRAGDTAWRPKGFRYSAPITATASRASERLIAHEARATSGSATRVTARPVGVNIWLHGGIRQLRRSGLWSEHRGGPHARRNSPATTRKQLPRGRPQDLLLADPGPRDMFDDRVYKRGAFDPARATPTAGRRENSLRCFRDWTTRYRHGSVITDDFTGPGPPTTATSRLQQLCGMSGCTRRPVP